ncbi:MAG: hypothetical protein ACPGVD_05475 [Flavobacteriales bacterium]
MLTNSEIAHYVQKRKEGWDNSQVRKEIKRKFRLEDSEVSYYVSEIDDLYVESLSSPLRSKISKRIQITIKLLSGFLLLGFAFLTLYFGYVKEDVLSVKLIGVLLLGGSGLIVSARRQKRKLTKSSSLSIQRKHKPKSFRDLFLGDW